MANLLDEGRRIRIRPMVRFVPIEDERWQVWIGSQCKNLEGRSLQDVIPALIEHLDGTCTVGEILRRVSKESGAESDVVRAALQRLYDWMLLDDDDGFPTVGPNPLEAQLNYFSLLSSKPVRLQQRVASARVAILGGAGIGENIALALASAGVRHLSLGRGEPLRPQDRAAFPYSPQDEGRRAGEAAAEILRRSRPETELTLVEDEELPEADLVVIAARGFTSPRVARTNQHCVAAGRPMLMAGIHLGQGFVGPLVLPGESPCLECLRRRFTTTLGLFADSDGAPPAELVPSAMLVASLAAMETVKFLSRALPASLVGHQLQIDPVRMTTTTIEIFKVPRCPVCGSLASRAPVASFDGSNKGNSDERMDVVRSAAQSD